MIQLWTVTRVYSNNTDWWQLCNIKAHLSGKEVQWVTILWQPWIDSCPTIWDLVAFTQVMNNVSICLWVIEQKDFKLSEWEVLIHRWKKVNTAKSSKYDETARIRLTKDDSVIIETWVSWTSSAAKIIMKKDWNIEITCTSLKMNWTPIP